MSTLETRLTALNETIMEKMTLEQAIDFAKKNAVPLPEKMRGMITADMLSCIDDRKTDGDPKIRIPGAGLGILMDTFGAKLNLSPEQILAAVEKALGGKLSYHTDKAHEGDALKCAGCGHCAGALAKPDDYLLTPEAVAFLQEKFLPDLDKACVPPEVYEGKHNAKGVIILSDTTTLTSSPDEMVYSYHPGLHRKAIDQIAAEIAQLHELNAQEVAEAIWASAQERLGHTVHHLADGLPQFKVSQTESGEVNVVAI
jgi:hypothetical protein